MAGQQVQPAVSNEKAKVTKILVKEILGFFDTDQVMIRGTNSCYQGPHKSWTEVTMSTHKITGKAGHPSATTGARADPVLVEATLAFEAATQLSNQLSRLQNEGKSAVSVMSQPIRGYAKVPLEQLALGSQELRILLGRREF